MPRFTLRNLFAVTAGVAVVALITSWGGQGWAWVVGISAAVATLLLVMLIHLALFGVVMLYSRFAGITSADPDLPAPRGPAPKPSSATGETP